MSQFKTATLATLTLVSTLTSLSAAADTVSTGDLGINIIYAENGGTYQWDFTVPSLQAFPEPSLFVRYGAWNGSSSDIIDITLNGTLLGSVTDLVGYLSPGPATVTLGAGGALQAGNNSLVFSMGGGTRPDYVINEATMTFTAAVPEPSSYAMLALGLAVVALRARRRLG
jgi:hypothetical protein